MEIKIKDENEGKRLDVFLSEFDTKKSRSHHAQNFTLSRAGWQKLIKSGNVLVNNKLTKAGYTLKEDDKISIQLSVAVEDDVNVNNEDLDIDVIFECEDYVVINKPAGVVVHHDDIHKGGTVVDWLLKKYLEIKSVGEGGREGIVHRFDKDVSGVMVVARTSECYKHLKEQFKERKVEKEYIALVNGLMEQDEGEVNLGISRSKEGKFVAHTQDLIDDRKALTRYEVLQRFKNFTLLKINILTGRTHQIRVHMNAIGHSVVGDELYATRDVRKKKNKEELDRLWLFSKRLGFDDISGERQEYEVETPQELQDYLDKLK